MKKLILLLLSIISIVHLASCSQKKLPLSSGSKDLAPSGLQSSDAPESLSSTEAATSAPLGSELEKPPASNVISQKASSSNPVPSSSSSNANNQKKQLTFGNTSGNISNGGYAVSDGTDIYYCVGKSIFKCSLNGSNSKKIYEYAKTDIGGISSLNIMENHLYFVDSAVCRMKKDGTERKELFKDSLMFIQVTSENIYCVGSTKIYKTNLDGTKKVELSDGDSFFVVTEEYAFYTMHQDFIRMNLDGSNKKTLSDKNFRYPCREGDWLYFTSTVNQYNIYKMKPDGTQYTMVSNDYVLSLNVGKDWIYYINKDNNICKVRTTGKDAVKLGADEARNINVAGDWIFYKSIGDDLFFRMKIDGSNKEQLFA